MTDAWRTIEAPVTHEIPKVKRSRFIADVAPVEDAEAARAHVDAVRKREHAARHVCWAYRLGHDGSVSRSSDDGEPSGSAGRPILQAIEGADVTHVVVAVTRYYGGVKLGVGGLVRAYGDAAAAGLAHADVKTIVPTRDVVVEVGYEQLGVIEALCAREGRERPEPTYGDRVTFVFSVPTAEAEGLAARVVEQSAGRATVTLGA